MRNPSNVVPPPEVRRTALVIAAVVVCSMTATLRNAYGCCDVIPATERTFRSTRGEVSTPVAGPGTCGSTTKTCIAGAKRGESCTTAADCPIDVTIRRPDAAVFDSNLALNEITLTFRPIGCAVGDPMCETVVPVPAKPAPDTDPTCTCPTGCHCLSFTFPDTDALLPPVDGRPLTGPVQIVVKTGGDPTPTAIIDTLFLPGTETPDSLFPFFVALPPANPVGALTKEPGGDILGAPSPVPNSTDTLLFIPFDYSSLIAPQLLKRRLLQTRFLDVQILNQSASPEITAFTADGRQLPPLLETVMGGDAFIGTVDTPASVLRVANLGPFVQPDGGPIAIADADVAPGVDDPELTERRADVLTTITTTPNKHFVVFENRECDQRGDPMTCRDLNGDLDTRDYFLYALDLRVPGSEPIVIDEVDGGDFAGYALDQFPNETLYNFVATDDLVAFQIAEVSGQDIDDSCDGHQPCKPNVVRSGAFDLERKSKITLATNSPRLEISGGLLAFAVREATGDILHFYDATLSAPGPYRVKDDTGAQFALNRLRGRLAEIFFSALSSCDISQTIACATAEDPAACNLASALSCNVFTLATNEKKIAFVPESAVPFEECAADPGLFLHVLDTDTCVITVPATSTAAGTVVCDVVNLNQPTLCGGVRMSSRWLTFWSPLFDLADPFAAPKNAVGVFDLSQPTPPLRFICDEGPCRFAVISPSLSDSIVPCGILEDSSFVGAVLPFPFNLAFDVCNTGFDLDRNGDGDAEDLVLKVLLPGASPITPPSTCVAPGAGSTVPGLECNLKLAIDTTIESMVGPLRTGNPPLISGDRLLVGVDEQKQGANDLNCDGLVGCAPAPSPGPCASPAPVPSPCNRVLPELPPAALFTFNAARRPLTEDPATGSLARALRGGSVATSLPPLLQFIDRGARIITPNFQRTLLRDLDDDGGLEEQITSPDPERSGAFLLDDNCPSTPNPDQLDTDRDGEGDACEPTPTTTPTATFTPPVVTATATAATPTVTLTPVVTVTPTVTLTPVVTVTPTLTATPVVTTTATITPTPVVTVTTTLTIASPVTPTATRTPSGCGAIAGRQLGTVRFAPRGRGAGHDLLVLHGRIDVPPIDPTTEGVAVDLANASGLRFEATLPAGAVERRSAHRFVFRDRAAERARVGIARLDLVFRPAWGQLEFRLRAFGDLSQATVAAMTHRLTVGGACFVSDAVWRATAHGWAIRGD